MDNWAITNVYIGQQCPEMCHGHGRCDEGLCHCDLGYHGDSCTPSIPLMDELKTDFSLMSKLEDDWLYIHGGRTAASNQGCGTILSGESLYFSLVSILLFKVQLQFL